MIRTRPSHDLVDLLLAVLQQARNEVCADAESLDDERRIGFDVETELLALVDIDIEILDQAARSGNRARERLSSFGDFFVTSACGDVDQLKGLRGERLQLLAHRSRIFLQEVR
ncbi:MAG: hypothetical protein JRG67_16110, partial [Deltaproteobacteria bacterium]|nr:hypothetical protein [Deltaproteobacteria bacterium]